eukprot:4343484-Prymnesium_polylepis.1
MNATRVAVHLRPTGKPRGKAAAHRAVAPLGLCRLLGLDLCLELVHEGGGWHAVIAEGQAQLRLAAAALVLIRRAELRC